MAFAPAADSATVAVEPFPRLTENDETGPFGPLRPATRIVPAHVRPASFGHVSATRTAPAPARRAFGAITTLGPSLTGPCSTVSQSAGVPSARSAFRVSPA